MKLDNKVIENPLLVRDSLSTQLLLYLIIISVKRDDGVIITTRKELSESTYISESSIQRRLKKLEDIGFIVQNTSNTQREIKIVDKITLNKSFIYETISKKCNICKKVSKRMAHISNAGHNLETDTCFLYKNRKCFALGIENLKKRIWKISNGQNYHFEIKIIEDDRLNEATYISKGIRKRKTIGLSLRYNVLKRDGFQCVLCGASGKEAKIEIDHIIPISKGGTHIENNLQTLCFSCNRGKSNKDS